MERDGYWVDSRTTCGYVQHVMQWLNAERFLQIGAGPPGVANYTYGQGRRRDYRLGAWKDRWSHVSLKTLQYEIGSAADLAHARTADQLHWVNRFHIYMPKMTTNELPIVITTANEVMVPDVIEDFDQVYRYSD